MAKGNHLFDCYNPPAITFERGEGAYLYTDTGEKYLDFIAGIAVNALGHAPKEIGDAIKDQGRSPALGSTFALELFASDFSLVAS